MVSRTKLLAALDQLLEPQRFRDHCPNGLQVAGRDEVSTVATCASVSLDFFEQAADEGADLLLVHHGLFWQGDSQVIDNTLARRLRVLLEAEMSLVAYHLPLDAHPELGNNACLARLAGLSDCRFELARQENGTALGCHGRLPQPRPLDEFAADLAAELECTPRILGAAPQRPIEKVAVLSGSGSKLPVLLEAAARGCQVLLTGEVREPAVAQLRELGLVAVALGHYNSEKLGVIACGDWLAEQFGLAVVHVDVPNPV